MLPANPPHRLEQAERLFQGGDDVEAQTGHAGVAAHGIDQSHAFAFDLQVANGNIARPAFELAVHVIAVVVADGIADPLRVEQAVAVELPFVPGEVVDDVVQPAIDARHVVEQRAVMDFGNAAFQEAAVDDGGRVGP